MSIQTLVWPQWWSWADVSQQGVDFSKKISKIRIIFDLIFTDVHTDCQKLNVILGIKVLQFWSYRKMYFTKNVVLNWYSSMKIFFRKIWTFFDIKNWLWKSDLGTFWQSKGTSVKVKSKKYFSFTDFFAKIKPLLTHVCKTPPLRSNYQTSNMSSLPTEDRSTVTDLANSCVRVCHSTI